MVGPGHAFCEKKKKGQKVKVQVEGRAGVKMQHSVVCSHWSVVEMKNKVSERSFIFWIYLLKY